MFFSYIIFKYLVYGLVIMESDIVVISGRSCELFKKEVVKSLIEKYHYKPDIEGPVVTTWFNSGEIFTQLGVNQANKRIHFFQSFYDPITPELFKYIKEDAPEDKKALMMLKLLSVNDDIMEMLLFGDAIFRADAPLGSVSVYETMHPYARQDKKDDGRVPISAALMYKLIKTAFGERLRNANVCELHAPQEQGFFEGPLKTIPVAPFFAMYVKHNFNLDDIVLVSPDSGGVARTRSLARLLGGVPTADIDKERPKEKGITKHGTATATRVNGNVEGKTVIFVDDMADSCGSLLEDYRVVREYGAKEQAYALVAHALMSYSMKKDDKKNVTGVKHSAESLLSGKIKLITTNTNSRNLEYYKQNSNIFKAVINLGEYFADLVHCNTTGDSFSAVIEGYKKMVDESRPADIERFLLK